MHNSPIRKRIYKRARSGVGIVVRRFVRSSVWSFITRHPVLSALDRILSSTHSLMVFFCSFLRHLILWGVFSKDSPIKLEMTFHVKYIQRRPHALSVPRFFPAGTEITIGTRIDYLSIALDLHYRPWLIEIEIRESRQRRLLLLFVDVSFASQRERERIEETSRYNRCVIGFSQVPLKWNWIHTLNAYSLIHKVRVDVTVWDHVRRAPRRANVRSWL